MFWAGQGKNLEWGIFILIFAIVSGYFGWRNYQINQATALKVPQELVDAAPMDAIDTVMRQFENEQCQVECAVDREQDPTHKNQVTRTFFQS
ncbi:MAG TPA: hypothetical protein VGB30_07685 [bacterium]|jgi:predicted negative regulator of RcsB-dependent stress response